MGAIEYPSAGLSWGRGGWSFGLDDTVVDIPPVRADVARWAPPPAEPVPALIAAPPTPAPLSREGRLGKVPFFGVDIIPWWGAANRKWFAVVPARSGDCLAEASTETQLLAEAARILGVSR